MLMIGPPSAGKTMLARRPSMTIEESLETTKVHSAVGLIGGGGADPAPRRWTSLITASPSDRGPLQQYSSDCPTYHQ